MPRPHRPSTLLPYTTLFRSRLDEFIGPHHAAATAEIAGEISFDIQPHHAERRDDGDKERADGDAPCRRSEEHTSELQSRRNIVCRLLLEKKKKKHPTNTT